MASHSDSEAANLFESGDLLRQAAAGSREAQSAMIEHTLLMSNAGVCRRVEALSGAELWARMAASHGTHDDLRRLGGVLLLRAEHERAEGDAELSVALEVEAVILLEGAADMGDECAANALAVAGSDISQEAFARLRAMRSPVARTFWDDAETKVRDHVGPDASRLLAAVLFNRVRDDERLSDDEREAKAIEGLRLLDTAVAGGDESAVAVSKMFGPELAWLRAGAPGDGPAPAIEGNC